MKKFLFLLFCLVTFFVVPMVGLFTSCKSTKNVTPVQIKGHFPSPYNEDGESVVISVSNQTVQMPLWYWLKIIDWEIDVETNIELLN